jgi:hypothetical protein
MGGSTANFSQAGSGLHPSPSIWADCPNTLLNDLGLGKFFRAGLTGGPVTTTVTAATPVIPGMSVLADTATVSAYIAGRVGGALDLETDGDDNDAYTLHTEPFGTITKNSGKKLWFEAAFELGDASADQGFFIGLVEETGATLELIVDDGASLIGDSYIGARVLSGTAGVLDIAYKKDAGTEVEVLAAAANSSALTAAGGTAAALADDTPRKFGLRFDGRETISFYIDGYKVGTQAVDSTIDQAKNYVAAFSLKTGTAAANSAAISMFQFAVQDQV